jgi:hypothetical protein
MSYIDPRDKLDIVKRPTIQVIRLYSLIHHLETHLLKNKQNEELIELINEINKIIRVINDIPHEEEVVNKYVPIGLLTLEEEDISIDEIKILISEFRASLEKSVMEQLEPTYKRKRPILVANINKFPYFTHPLEKLLDGYKYMRGEIPCIITVPHSKPPFHDQKTLPIAKDIAKKSRAHLIYTNISRIYIDYNRRYARYTPFRRRISSLIKEHNIKLLLDIHGRERNDIDVEIGWAEGMTASIKTIYKLLNILDRKGLSYKYEETIFSGGDIIRYHSIPGRNEAIQLELSYKARTKKREILTDTIVEFIEEVI